MRNATGFSACSKYAIVSRNWSSIVSPITAIVARYGLREFFCVLRLWGNRATVEIRPGLPRRTSLFLQHPKSLCSRPGHGRTVAVEANVAAVGREIGGRQKGPARAGSFHCRCKQFAGGGGPCANAAIRFRGDRSGGFRQRHSLFLYRARFRRTDRLVNLGCRIRGFRTVCRTDVSCFRQAGLARFASVPNNNFHWKFVLLENSRTFVV